MTAALRSVTAALAIVLLAGSAATAAEDPRALVVEGEELLSANHPQRALDTFKRVRVLLGTTPPRLQADLVRAAAAVGDDVLTQTEHAAWLRLERRDAVIDAELQVLATRAAERIQAREEREKATVPLIENERRIRAAEDSARAADAVRVRESDVAFAADEAKRAMRSRDTAEVDAAIRRIDRVSGIYPDHPRVGELAVARANLVNHGMMTRELNAGLASAAEQQSAAKRASRARGYYLIGALKVVAGLAITGGGLYLMIVQPESLGRPASVGFGAASIALGLGLVVVSAPDSFRAGAQARASTSWSLAAAGLPGGGFLGAMRAF